MRRVLASLLLVLLLLLPIYAHDWTAATARVERSLVRVTHPHDAGGEYVCTGFSINKRHSNILTAYHCIQMDLNDPDSPEAEHVYVDGQLAYVLAKWPDYDLVILSGTWRKPSLDYRQEPVRKGLPVAALGFAYGRVTDMLLTGVIAAPSADWGIPGPEGNWQTVDRPFIGGMSGGPIFDEFGDVVGVVQQADDWTGISRPLSEIVQLTKRYWD